MTAGDRAARERRVLVFVATRRDADVSVRLLAQAGLAATICESSGRLTAEIGEGAAAILTTEQMIEGPEINELLKVLKQQEEWSDLPLVLLMHGGAQSKRAIDVLQRLSNVTILDRPAGMRSVLSAVQAAVRGRLRQYETRAHIQAIRDAEAKAREAESRARQADRAKDDFLASLSHELRTPLTPALLLATEAAQDPTLPEAVRADFQVIAKNIGLEERLIDDLLDVTRISHGKLKLARAQVDVIEVLSDAIATVRSDFKDKRLRLSTQFATSQALVEGDAARLQQAFWNVLKNAAKFTPEGGQVTVRARNSTDHDGVIVEVADTGIGMTADELQRVFTAFEQGHHAVEGAHRFGGLGLGLAISRSLVEMHRGTIAAESAGAGQGSTFRIELPLAPADASIAARNPPTHLASRTRRAVPLRILLVEDHASTRHALVRLLTARGHGVTAAGSLAEARACAASAEFDLLMTDIGLPDGDGYRLGSELTASGNVLSIALTGYGTDEDLERSKTAGFFAHLTKPVRVTDLDQVLNRVVEALTHSAKP